MAVMSLQSPRVTRGNATPSGPAGSRPVVSYHVFILKTKQELSFCSSEWLDAEWPVWPCYLARGEVSLSFLLLGPLKESLFPNEHLKHLREHFLTLLRKTLIPIIFSQPRSRSVLLKTILSYKQI